MGPQRAGKKVTIQQVQLWGSPKGQNVKVKDNRLPQLQDKLSNHLASYSKKNKCRHNPRNKGIFPRYYGKVLFPDQELLSCDMEMSLQWKRKWWQVLLKRLPCLPCRKESLAELGSSWEKRWLVTRVTNSALTTIVQFVISQRNAQ